MRRHSIVLVQPRKAFLPEFRAIGNYLVDQQNFDVLMTDDHSYLSDPQVDAAFVSLGFIPRLRNRRSVIVGRYASASTGFAYKFKDFAKRNLNLKFDFVLCQNQFVFRHACGPRQEVLYLPMGFFPELIQERKSAVFDAVYSGTVNRPGVEPTLMRLAQLGLKVAVVGSNETVMAHSNIANLGQLPIQEVYEIYSVSKFGLNLVPNKRPFAQQASTKLIEYVAAGLKVITTQYPWAQRFAAERNAGFLELTTETTRREIETFEYSSPPIPELSWPNLLSSLNLSNVLTKSILRKNAG